jgi:hypothetical protein
MLGDRVARFFKVQHTKMGTNIPDDQKIYQTAIKYVHRMAINTTLKYTKNLTFQGLLKDTKIVVFSGMQIYHLATLLSECSC